MASEVIESWLLFAGYRPWSQPQLKPRIPDVGRQKWMQLSLCLNRVDAILECVCWD